MIHSFKLIIFPWDDIPSQDIARKWGIDPSCADTDLFGWPEACCDIEWLYWSHRLEVLMDLLDSNSSSKISWKWAKRNSIALIAMSTLVIGIATLAIDVWSKRNED